MSAMIVRTWNAPELRQPSAGSASGMHSTSRMAKKQGIGVRDTIVAIRNQLVVVWKLSKAASLLSENLLSGLSLSSAEIARATRDLQVSKCDWRLDRRLWQCSLVGECGATADSAGVSTDAREEPVALYIAAQE